MKIWSRENIFSCFDPLHASSTNSYKFSQLCSQQSQCNETITVLIIQRQACSNKSCNMQHNFSFLIITLLHRNNIIKFVAMEPCGGHSLNSKFTFRSGKDSSISSHWPVLVCYLKTDLFIFSITMYICIYRFMVGEQYTSFVYTRMHNQPSHVTKHCQLFLDKHIS